MCHRTHFGEPSLPYQSFRRPFNPAAFLWHWLFSSWEQQVFIGFGISRILVVACLTFNSEVPAKAASSPSLTSAISSKLWSGVRLLNRGKHSYIHWIVPNSHNFCPPWNRSGYYRSVCVVTMFTARFKFLQNIERWHIFTLCLGVQNTAADQKKCQN